MLYNPYERPHAFLELFCSCLLPTRLDASVVRYDTDTVLWNNDYLKDLSTNDIDYEGNMIANTLNKGGNSFYISHNIIENKFGILLKKGFKYLLKSSVVSKHISDKNNNLYFEIAKCDLFIIILSPYYMSSKKCLKELEIALKFNKKIIPVTFYKNIQNSWIPNDIRNIAPFQITDINFNRIIDLCEEINNEYKIDYYWIRMHTRILLRSIFWELNDFRHKYLITGKDILRSINWLNTSFLIDNNNDYLKPTLLQSAFIIESKQESRLTKKRRMNIAILILIFTLVSIFPNFSSFVIAIIFIHGLIAMSGDDLDGL